MTLNSPPPPQTILQSKGNENKFRNLCNMNYFTIIYSANKSSNSTLLAIYSSSRLYNYTIR